MSLLRAIASSSSTIATIWRGASTRASKLLMQAGFDEPETFVAPYDRFTRTSMEEVARRFKVISTAWFEWGRLPAAWWPRYF